MRKNSSSAGEAAIADKLAKMIGGTAPAARKDFTVAVINYPGFHPTPFMESWHGFGWSEWDIATRCRPRFKGHRQPLECLWGPFDESDPKWAAKETATAADHGIDVWIYDWYWYSGIEIWNEALNNGFLHAPNRKRMKFGVMWANHTWQNNHPAPLNGPLESFLPIRHSMEDLDRVVDYWSERYFCQDNYWRIDGKPWCSIFLPGNLIEYLGGVSGAARGLERMRRRARKNGQSDLFIGAFCFGPDDGKVAAEIGFDHTTTYNVVGGAHQEACQPLVDYADVMEAHVQRWQDMQKLKLPYWPVVTQGWDVSARNHPYEPWPPAKWGWPWGHIVTNNTPQRFGELACTARRFMATQPASTKSPKVMVINAWNEWTEGSMLLPTKDEGYGVLKALKKSLA